MSIWSVIDGATDTRATEIPGVGTVIATPGLGMCFVPQTRLVMLQKPLPCGATHVQTRDDRTAPPLVRGRSAKQIIDEQGDNPDPGSRAYYTTDEPDY